MLYKDSLTVGSRKQKMVKTELGQVPPHTDHQRGGFFSINRQELLEFFKPSRSKFPPDSSMKIVQPLCLMCILCILQVTLEVLLGSVHQQSYN